MSGVAAGQPVRYEVDVTDPMGRARKVVVETIPGRVSVVAPPGEGFSMDADQADTLAYQLRCAADNARGHHAAKPPQ